MSYSRYISPRLGNWMIGSAIILLGYGSVLAVVILDHDRAILESLSLGARLLIAMVYLGALTIWAVAKDKRDKSTQT